AMTRSPSFSRSSSSTTITARPARSSARSAGTVASRASEPSCPRTTGLSRPLPDMVRRSSGRLLNGCVQVLVAGWFLRPVTGLAQRQLALDQLRHHVGLEVDDGGLPEVRQ